MIINKLNKDTKIEFNKCNFSNDSFYIILPNVKIYKNKRQILFTIISWDDKGNISIFYNIENENKLIKEQEKIYNSKKYFGNINKQSDLEQLYLEINKIRNNQKHWLYAQYYIKIDYNECDKDNIYNILLFLRNQSVINHLYYNGFNFNKLNIVTDFLTEEHVTDNIKSNIPKIDYPNWIAYLLNIIKLSFSINKI